MFKTMGDGFLVEFPSVVSAVECALALQTNIARLNDSVAETRRLRYRMGINHGDVLVEGDDHAEALPSRRRSVEANRTYPMAHFHWVSPFAGRSTTPASK